MGQSITFENSLQNIYPLLLSKKKRKYMIIKRVLDVIIAGVCLVIMSPVFIAVAICIKCEEPYEKVFFFQKRVGCNGKIFNIIKFRSMKSNMPDNLATCNVKNPEKYMSCVGKFIRKSSIDELPQLWNVLRGDMSIIGPRPLILAEKEIHTLRQRYGIYQILPGITGLAQVNGRDILDICEKVSLDWMYLKCFGPIQDIKIICSTIKVVFKHEGYHEGKILKYMKEDTNDTRIHCWEQGNTG